MHREAVTSDLDGKHLPTTQASARLLVIIPALNEAATIQEVVKSIPRSMDGVREIQILVIDDGSSDDTALLAKSAGAEVISHPFNLGVGAALQSGLQEARRRAVDVAVNIDADGQFNASDIPKLIEPILKAEVDFTTASRFKDPTLVPEMPPIKRLGNWGMARIVSRICGANYADVSCGFRAYGREALLRLILHGRFTYTQESFISLSIANLRILEVPLVVTGERIHGKSRIASNLLTYTTRTVAIIYNVIRDYRPARFFNAVAAGCVLVALGTGAFFFYNYLVTGQFSPHLWAGFLSAFSFGIALLLFFAGQTADMIARLRTLQEQQLYLLRKHLESEHTAKPRGDRD